MVKSTTKPFSKVFDWREYEDALEWIDEQKAEGYRVWEIEQLSDQYIYVVAPSKEEALAFYHSQPGGDSELGVIEASTSKAAISDAELEGNAIQEIMQALDEGDSEADLVQEFGRTLVDQAKQERAIRNQRRDKQKSNRGRLSRVPPKLAKIASALLSKDEIELAKEVLALKSPLDEDYKEQAAKIWRKYKPRLDVGESPFPSKEERRILLDAYWANQLPRDPDYSVFEWVERLEERS